MQNTLIKCVAGLFDFLYFTIDNFNMLSEIHSNPHCIGFASSLHSTKETIYNCLVTIKNVTQYIEVVKHIPLQLQWDSKFENGLLNEYVVTQFSNLKRTGNLTLTAHKSFREFSKRSFCFTEILTFYNRVCFAIVACLDSAQS